MRAGADPVGAGIRALVDPLLFIPRLVRDHWAEKAGRYPYSARYDGRYLSQWAIAVACDAYGGVPYLMYGIEGRPELLDWSTYEGLPDGAAAWIRIEDLPEFNRRILPGLSGRIVMVTGESDYNVPSTFTEAVRTLLESGRLLRWFATNYVGNAQSGPITGLPLGLRYAKRTDVDLYGRFGWRGLTPVSMASPRVQECAWEAKLRGARPRAERPPTVVADFHLNDTSRDGRHGESRTDIWRQLQGNPLVHWLTRRTSFGGLLRAYAGHAFVISPHGRGLDCYRTWEALFAGCIPIVKTSALDPLYDGLPVAIVQDWREINAASVERWLDRFAAASYQEATQRVLSARHWEGRIKGRPLSP